MSKTEKQEQPKRRYKALVDLYTPEREIKAGEVVTDLPRSSVSWLLADGLIEEVDDGV
jgi:hypothetical protein